jgi:hypothetical protein
MGIYMYDVIISRVGLFLKSMSFGFDHATHPLSSMYVF